MIRRLWRIGVDARTYEAHDLSGKGAEVSGGRWNAPGVAAVYASESRALACLETLVHLNASGLPLNRYLVAIDVPERLWAAADSLSPNDLPVGWDAQPAGKVSIDWGTHWLKAMTAALLILPSTTVPEEKNILLNPAHPDSTAMSAAKVREWVYDPRLVQAA